MGVVFKYFAITHNAAEHSHGDFTQRTNLSGDGSGLAALVESENSAKLVSQRWGFHVGF